MCHRCANIDYPIGDAIWLPCGGSPDRYTARKPTRIPTTPSGGFSDEDYDQQGKIDSLMRVIRKQREEIAILKAKQLPPPPKPTFEGAE